MGWAGVGFYRYLLVACLVVLAPGPAEAIDFRSIFPWTRDKAEDAGEVILDPLDYTITFDVATPDDDLAKQLRRSTGVWMDRETPASGAAGLISVAQSDYRALLATLYREGYYAAAISILINGAEAADITLTDDLPNPSVVSVRVDPGPRYAFGKTVIENAPRFNKDEREDDGTPLDLFQPGRVARSSTVADVGAQAVTAWRRAGHPKAKVAEREVIADHDTNALDVTIRLDPGPAATFGRVRVKGTRAVDREFTRYIADIPEGERFDPEVIDQAVDRLNRLGVFRATRIEERDTLRENGRLPLVIDVAARPPRRIGFGVTASSTEGLGIEGFWLHRNLFGKAERLRFDASVDGILDETMPENFDYQFGVAFTKPGVFNPNTDLETKAEVRQFISETFEEQAAEVSLGLSRRFTKRLTGSAAVGLEYSDITDDLGNREFLTVSLPVGLQYDRRNNELDATRGYFLRGEVSPFQELEFDTTAVRAEFEARGYVELAEEDTVLAARAFWGTVVGGDLLDLPTGQLFFAGGGGSIRGFEFQAVGLDIDGNELGGRSKLELALELRQRIGRNFGIVGFVDSGIVSDDIFPSSGSYSVGVGGGIRYYSGLGPLRFDVATPLNGDNEDPAIAVYIGIGQAF